MPQFSLEGVSMDCNEVFAKKILRNSEFRSVGFLGMLL